MGRAQARGSAEFIGRAARDPLDLRNDDGKHPSRVPDAMRREVPLR